MTTETVIHGKPDSDHAQGWARCGEERPETITTNPATMTCVACIVYDRKRIHESLKWHRKKLVDQGEALRVLDGDEFTMTELVTVGNALHNAIRTINLRLEIDATAAQADSEGAPDGS